LGRGAEGALGHLAMAGTGAHIELLNFLLKLKDTVLELADVLVLPTGQVTKLVLCIAVVVLHMGELLMLPVDVLLKGVILLLCNFKAIMHSSDLITEDLIVLCQQGLLSHKVSLKVCLLGGLSTGERDIMLDDALDVMMHPQGAKLAGTGLVGNGKHPVIKEPGWNGGIMHGGTRRRRCTGHGRHAGTHSFAVGGYSLSGDGMQVGGCKIEEAKARHKPL